VVAFQNRENNSSLQSKKRYLENNFIEEDRGIKLKAFL
jgi:hypothetical protein